MESLPDKKKILYALQKGEITTQGQFIQGSNYTFQGQVTYDGQTYAIVYKPIRGEQPLWDFPIGSLARREVAAFLVSDSLGWELVPPTVYRQNGPYGPGSIQYFVEHDANYHYFNFTPADIQRLRPTVAFDMLINNADRKGSHVLKDPYDHIWLIDHGVCFHTEDKLRTVIWDFSGEPIPTNLLSDLIDLDRKLNKPGGRLANLLCTLLSTEEVEALSQRSRLLAQIENFPSPATDRRPYPWPPL